MVVFYQNAPSDEFDYPSTISMTFPSKSNVFQQMFWNQILLSVQMSSHCSWSVCFYHSNIEVMRKVWTTILCFTEVHYSNQTIHWIRNTFIIGEFPLLCCLVPKICRFCRVMCVSIWWHSQFCLNPIFCKFKCLGIRKRMSSFWTLRSSYYLPTCQIGDDAVIETQSIIICLNQLFACRSWDFELKFFEENRVNCILMCMQTVLTFI